MHCLLYLALLATVPSILAKRRYLSANSFDSVDDVTSRASVRIHNDRDLAVCSGTLIADNLVYTAAHCMDNYNASEMYISVPTDPTYYHRVKASWFPSEFTEGKKFDEKYKGDDYGGVSNYCGTITCDSACIKTSLAYPYYYSQKDYGLLLLAEAVLMCEQQGDTVAAELTQDDYSKGNPRETKDMKEECFVAGYGTTDTRGAGSLNMVIASRLSPTTQAACPNIFPKTGVTVAFHNSTKKNVAAEICSGDSGSGVVCLGNNGTKISVKALVIESHGDGPKKGIEGCVFAHSSYALATGDHWSPLILQMEKWKMLDNYFKWQTTCAEHLQSLPFGSVMQNYLKKEKQF